MIERNGLVVGHVTSRATRTPPALQETTELDGTRQVVTWISGAAWLEDPNGAVREASGDELASCELSHALWFQTWLDGDVEGFDVRFDDSAPGAPVVHLRPSAGGPERRLVLGPTRDGAVLPVRFERSESGTPVTTTFEDWRIVDGVRFPFVSEQRTGDSRFDVTGRTTSLRLLDALPDGNITAPAVRSPGDGRITDPARARDIPLERPGGIFLVRVEVNGTPDLAFLLDTGAGATVIASEWAAAHGLESRGVLEARGAAGSESAAYVRVQRLRLPGVELSDQMLVTVPLASLGVALGTPVDGILGWDFLSRFAVEIDEPRNRLAVSPSGAYTPRDGMARLPMRIELNVPRIEGVLDGNHPGSFLLDTGNATEVLLHSSFAAAHGYLDRATDASVTLSGIGGDARIRQVDIASLSLGEVRFANLAAVLAPSGSGVISLEEAIGNLGAKLLTGRVLGLDYGAGAAWLSATGAPAAASADSASTR